MKLKTAIAIVIGFILLVLSLSFVKSCHEEKKQQPSAQVFQVIPDIDQTSLSKLPALPNYERPVSTIVVPLPKQKPGHVLQPAVVVSSVGNTFVVYSDRIDYGFHFYPKASAGISSDILMGVDISFFTWWRINADALLFVPISSGFEKTRAGIGASYQVTNNTSAGVAYLVDISDRRTWALFVSLKF